MTSLKDFGYSEGEYHIICETCGSLEHGVARFASTCLKCAEKALAEHLSKTDWVARWMARAHENASWSKDPTTKVGAVIFDGKRSVSEGFNGLPSKIKDDYEKIDRETKNLITIHAEMNAILWAKRDLSGMSICATHHPCSRCMSAIIQSGIEKVYIPKQQPVEFSERWANDIILAKKLAEEANIEIIELTSQK